jgi:magnesium transporter
MTSPHPEDRLQQSLREVEALLERHRLLERITHRQEGPRRELLDTLQHRQNRSELHKQLRTLHQADIAYVLESLAVDDRQMVWDELELQQAAWVFVELSPTVRASLASTMDRQRLIDVLSALDAEDLGYVSASVPPDVLRHAFRVLEASERTVAEESLSYDEDEVGYYMTREWVAVPEGFTVHQVLADLRRRETLPPQTDRIFVTDARNVLRGAVTLPALLLQDPSAPIVSALAEDTAMFRPHDSARDAVRAFERYDLVSAPVVDERGKLAGRLTVDAAMDFVRHEANLQALKSAGLSGDEDLFAAPMSSARNRWPWLAINLLTAFVASRVIGQFEGTIEQLASLATLMPIVASIGGNTGNQTMALVIRALAFDRIRGAGAQRLLTKELIISILNGTVWGGVIGLIAMLLYASFPLGLVMTAAVVLNLVVAGAAGVLIPLALNTSGRDPAHGSSVLLTFVTDAMGFLLFLGLASLFLV